MKKIIKAIAVFAIGILIIGSLAFCGKAQKETTTGKPAETTPEVTAGVEAETLSIVEMLEKATQSAEERQADSKLGGNAADGAGTENNGNAEPVTEPSTEETSQAENPEEPETTGGRNPDGNELFEDGTTTALGLSVPNNTRGTYFSLYEVANLNGDYVWQDGSWMWIDASETAPERGDIVVYTSQSMGGGQTHVAICVSGYSWSETDGCVKYKCVDGNYGPEPGTVVMGFSYYNTPNKGWTDSFTEAPGVEIGLGVWRSEYGELLAEGAEAAYYECQEIGQTAFLEKYIPEGVYGGWCYYMVPIAVNKVARGEY